MQNQQPPFRNPADDFMPRLVAFTGFMGSGKDTAAAILLQQYGFTKVAFGDGVKDMLRAIGFADGLLHEPIAKNMPVPWLDSGITPRKAMQTLGTEWGRRMVDNNLWVNVVEQKLKVGWRRDDLALFALTDVRFPNEIEMARDMGATVIHIRRGKLSWWRRLKARVGHASEQILPVRPGDYVVQNDSTVEDLHRRVLAACYGQITQGVTRG